MPELPGGERRKGKRGHIERLLAWQHLKREGRWVKTGMDSLVTMLPDDPNVYAYSFRGKEKFRAREIFHIHKVLHTLFPEHFPRIKAAFEHAEGQEPPGGTIREYVEIDKSVPHDNSPLNWFIRNYISHDTPGDLNGPVDAFVTMGVEKGIDYNPPNIRVDMKHHEQYLDTADEMAELLFERRFDVADYMRSQGYEDAAITSVEKNLLRLGELIRERDKKPKLH